MQTLLPLRVHGKAGTSIHSHDLLHEGVEWLVDNALHLHVPAP